MLAVCAALGNQLAEAFLKRSTTRAVVIGSLLVAAGTLGAFALAQSAWFMTVTIAAFGAAIGAALTTTFTAGRIGRATRSARRRFRFPVERIVDWLGDQSRLSGLVASRSIKVVFLSGAALLLVIVAMVQRLMAERAPAIESAPSVDEP